MNCFMGGPWGGSGIGSSLPASFVNENRIFRSSLILAEVKILSQNFFFVFIYKI